MALRRFLSKKDKKNNPSAPRQQQPTSVPLVAEQKRSNQPDPGYLKGLAKILSFLFNQYGKMDQAQREFRYMRYVNGDYNIENPANDEHVISHLHSLTTDAYKHVTAEMVKDYINTADKTRDHTAQDLHTLASADSKLYTRLLDFIKKLKNEFDNARQYKETLTAKNNDIKVMIGDPNYYRLAMMHLLQDTTNPDLAKDVIGALNKGQCMMANTAINAIQKDIGTQGDTLLHKRLPIIRELVENRSKILANGNFLSVNDVTESAPDYEQKDEKPFDKEADLNNFKHLAATIETKVKAYEDKSNARWTFFRNGGKKRADDRDLSIERIRTAIRLISNGHANNPREQGLLNNINSSIHERGQGKFGTLAALLNKEINETKANRSKFLCFNFNCIFTKSELARAYTEAFNEHAGAFQPKRRR